MPSRRLLLSAAALLLAATAPAAWAQAPAPQTLLNVSYAFSREFYKAYNEAFAAHWLKTTGQRVTLNQSHGGSSRQARSACRTTPRPPRA